MSSLKAKLARYEIRNIVEGEEVGSGSYGIVRKVTLDGITRIAKRIHDIFLKSDIRDHDKERTRIRFDQECVLLSELDHPNIVEFLGVQFDRTGHVSVLIMEYLHRDLEKFLKPQENPNVPLSIKLAILQDITSGLVYLHTQLKEPLVHRDLNAGNILLTVDIRAKIADLGMSKILDYHPSSVGAHTVCPGAQAYMPPEALQDKPLYGTALDIFSFGHLALYVALQEFPKVYEPSMNNVDSRALMKRFIDEEKVQLFKRKKWIDMLSDDDCLKSTIEQCLLDRPISRPGTRELNKTLKRLRVQHLKSCNDISSVWRNQAEEGNEGLYGKLEKANRTMHTLHTERKVLAAELKCMKEESIRFIRDQNVLSDLRKKHANLVDEHEQVLKSMQAMGVLSSQLAESERTVRALKRQLESIKKDMQAKSSQAKQYAKEVERLKQQLQSSAQVVGDNPINGHSSPDNVACMNDLSNTALDDSEHLSSVNSELYEQVKELKRVNVLVNELYNTAQDDKHLSSVNSELYDQVEELKRANTCLMKKLSSLSNNEVQKEDREQGLAIQDGKPEGVPKKLLSPTSPDDNHMILSKAQQASDVAESQQIILSAPLQVEPCTADTESTSQSLPNLLATPESLVDNSEPPSTIVGTLNFESHLSASSKMQNSPKVSPRSQKIGTEPKKEHVVPDLASQPPTSVSDSLQHESKTSVEDSITQFENPLVKELDDKSHQQTAKVIQDISGRKQEIRTIRQRPFDPNLVCPMCRRQFRIGEIQKFKRHVNTCTGTDD